MSPAGAPDPMLAIAGSRAGAVGVLDLQLATDREAPQRALAKLAALGRNRFGVLLGDDHDLLSMVVDTHGPSVDLVVFAGLSEKALAARVARLRAQDVTVAAVVNSLDQALAAEAAGVDGLIAKGHEAGGAVGEEGTFVLLQRLVARARTPVWAHGGVGLHTVAACRAAGAAGAVLDSQLLLARESPLPESVRSQIEAMDGSETACLGHALDFPVRVYSRPGLEAVAELRAVEAELVGQSEADAAERWGAELRRRIDWRGGAGTVLAVGQDACFAADLARRFTTVGGILAALAGAADTQCRMARDDKVLAEGSPWAMAHGTRYPLAQGPMTRVSDRPEFAAAVAGAGGLPFLALALMRAPDVRSLLEATRDQLDGRPWGVGILGFVPNELRAEQLEVIRTCRPTFALIAGGRPDQAAELEAQGIPTYLHVPSPGLLRLYLRDGARRFVFEGRECGGHVGPRTSFVLWDTMVRTLLAEVPPAAASGYDVLFAGGIHDARSGAMLAATAAPLAELGVRVGALLGTAHLFTEEAVSTGAITEGFQQAAIACVDTVLLESGPGHATRCLPSPFTEDFSNEKAALAAAGTGADEVRNRLEELNIGRLRIAAKGVDHHPRFGQDPQAPRLAEIDAEGQWRRGMYMIGQIAALRDGVCTIADLHHSVSAGSGEHLASLVLPDPRAADAAADAAIPAADVAIVGIGCILPGASDARALWANIVDKVDAITEVPATRWDWRAYFDPDPGAPDKVYSRWGGFVDDVVFDPLAFGMPPRSLTSIEPFQLLGLLVARAALDNAGLGDGRFARLRTSVMIGAGGGGADLGVGYTVRASLPMYLGESAAELTQELGDRLPEWTEDSFAGVLMNVAAGRIANRFDLGGMNFTVDAACASSLAAVSLAVRDLQAGTSDVVVVGGVDAIQNPFSYLCFSKTHALSPTGRCRPFDAQADGIAISEGFAAAVLKRRVDAERDGDRIYAVIRGVGGASDGRDRSLTAPRPEGQMRALRRAYAQAGYSPDTVELVEAHGTGTVAGDRAEVEALSTVFAEAGSDVQRCALGSVKSMIGHTKATAGVAGLVKAALALHHKVLPPTLGVTSPNPAARFEQSPFYVNTETRPWINGGEHHPRRAGVSAFGFGGTNFHVALEEYTGDFVGLAAAPVDSWPAELFVWRGASGAEVAAQVGRVVDGMAAGAEPSMADLALSTVLAADRSTGSAVLAVVASSLEDLGAKLAQAQRLLAAPPDRHHGSDGVHWTSGAPAAAQAGVAFLFPGQGSQAVGMARDLAVAFPVVREGFELADRVLEGSFDRPLSRFVFPPPTFTPDDKRARQAELTRTDVAQPALAAAELACLRLLRSLGVDADVVAGHSFGELVALCAAGSLADDDLLRLAAARGRFMGDSVGEGGTGMAAVDAGPDALAELVRGGPDGGGPDRGGLVLANMNAPRQTVVSGTLPEIDRALEWCRASGLRARALPVAGAFHSRHVAGAQKRFAELVDRTALAPPRVPVFSNTTAGPYPDEPSGIRRLLGEHLARPVEFVREIEAMYQAGVRVFVEVGPRSVLSGLTGQILGDRPHLCVPIDNPGRHGVEALLDGLAALVTEGVAFRGAELFRGRSARRFDLGALSAATGKPALAPTAWLVNGGRARPAGDGTADEIRPPVPVLVDNAAARPEPPVPPTATTAEAVAPVPAAAPTAVAPSARPGRAEEGAAGVMERYQSVMRRFLATQQSVMVSYLHGASAACVPGSELPVPGRTAALAITEPAARRDPGEATIDRFVVRAVAVDAPSAGAGLAAEGVVVVVDDGRGVGDELASRLRSRGHQVVMVASPGNETSADAVVVDVTEPGSVVEFADRLSRDHGRAKALVYLSCLGAGRDPRPGPIDVSGVPGELVGLFLMAQALQPGLEASAQHGGAIVLVATGMGGTFGIAESAGDTPPEHGAVAGFVKSLAQEWVGVRAKAVDLASADPALSAEWLLAEIDTDDAIVEVGCSPGARHRLEPTPTPVSGRQGRVPLDRDSVVLVTGGARGITAEAAIDLAERYQPCLVLVGRTPLPAAPEAASTAGITDPRKLRLGVIEARRAAALATTPVVVEQVCRRLLAQREVADTMERLGRTGARVEYRTCDVRDPVAFAHLIDGVYETFGRIDGVIHGAGIIEDKLIRDKQLASLQRVVSTKLVGARVLAAKLRPEGLAFVVFFSSVSGRFGNRGQADYAAASEVLNKLALDLDRRWAARVVSINWGPWLTTGMVSPEIRRQFASRGVSLIPIDVGCRLLNDELCFGHKGEVEVVMAGGRHPSAAPVAPASVGSRSANRDGLGASSGETTLPLLSGNVVVAAGSAASLRVLRTFHLDRDLFLDHHRIDGRPVVPFAVAMELMAEVAALAQPSLELVGLRDVRLLRGITVGDGGEPVVIVATTGPNDNGGVSLDVVVTAAADPAREHYRAVVDMAHHVTAPDGLAPDGAGSLHGLAPFAGGVARVYEDFLFHGPLFQGIAELAGMGAAGATSLLRPSDPAACVLGAEGDWLIDPVVVDCALQMQVVWARAHWDLTPLPTRLASYRRFGSLGQGSYVHHELRVRPESDSPFSHADHLLRDSEGHLLGALDDMVGTGSRALNRLAGSRP